MTRLIPLLLALGLPACGDKDGDDTSDSVIQEVREASSASWTVSWVPTPDPVPFNDYFDVDFTVTPVAGGAVPDDLAITVDARMPTHGHGMTVTPVVTDEGDGHFSSEGFLLHMEGRWELLVVVTSAGASESIVFDVPCCG